mmetsp:Transcript_70636/g.183340  ORF Transcript_70636/g.183340 Transcript_70636/m.183340 type:complete len:204 (-) Transcript_70636:785-1396(-)
MDRPSSPVAVLSRCSPRRRSRCSSAWPWSPPTGCRGRCPARPRQWPSPSNPRRSSSRRVQCCARRHRWAGSGRTSTVSTEPHRWFGGAPRGTCCWSRCQWMRRGPIRWRSASPTPSSVARCTASLPSSSCRAWRPTQRRTAAPQRTCGSWSSGTGPQTRRRWCPRATSRPSCAPSPAASGSAPSEVAPSFLCRCPWATPPTSS